jgi:hypothetical protein
VVIVSKRALTEPLHLAAVRDLAAQLNGKWTLDEARSASVERLMAELGAPYLIIKAILAGASPPCLFELSPAGLSLEFPGMFSNKNAYINQIISLDNVLEGIEKKVRSVQAEAKTGIAARNDATKKLEELAAVRDLLGIQQRTVTDPAVWKTLPPGEYIVLNPKTGFKQLQIKYDGPAR